MGINGHLKSCSCKIPRIQPGNLLNLIQPQTKLDWIKEKVLQWSNTSLLPAL